MAATTFIDKVTIIGTAWLNEVNTLVHTIFGGATSKDQARANLGAATSGANSDIQSLNGLTTPLSVTQGGTGASDAEGARSNLGIEGSSLSNPVTVAQGGTGATDAPTARSNLGAAASGANSDIQSLAGLSTPLSVAQGGTGAADAAAARTNLGARPAFAGVLLYLVNDQIIDQSVMTPLSWDAIEYQVGGSFANPAGANPTRITIPAGVSFVRFASQTAWGSLDPTVGWTTTWLVKNGIIQDQDPAGAFRHIVSASEPNGFQILPSHSGVIPVVENDFFELYVFQTSIASPGTEVQGSNHNGGASDDRRTWFSMEVVG